MTTADLLLAELEKSVKDLLNYGEHEGACTNTHQMSLVPKVAPCTKHKTALDAREKRVLRALEQVKLLRDVFSSGFNE